MFDLAREGKATEEVAQVVGQGEELEPYFVVAKLVAGKARPGQILVGFQPRSDENRLSWNEKTPS